MVRSEGARFVINREAITLTFTRDPQPVRLCLGQGLSRHRADRFSYDGRMLNRADDLATMTVLDEQGKPVELGTFWRERPAVLVFLRHFG